MPQDESYLLYMLIAARRVREYLKGISRANFSKNPEKQDAVILQVGNIGEAANHVTKAFQQAHSDIPWAKIIGMRHRVVHGYHEIDLEEVWRIASESVPALILMLEPLIPPEDSL
jgi:uncharacterized protein with HEPN domain